jgi:nucleoside-diphosphate-sugar epimerase
MKVLFIGGTGIISSACAAYAVQNKIDLFLLSRGSTTHRPAPREAEVLRADINDPDATRRALKDLRFDAVVNFIVFRPEQIERDIALFRGRTHQYVFISSASAYQTPPGRLPVTESTPLDNPFWGYSRAKIACEERLLRAYREEKFPFTIVRPSHTYDRTVFPTHGGYTAVDRMRRGKPVVVHGDGTSLWTLTHHRDFAKAFVGLLGHDGAIGEAIHITSDEALSWNQIHEILGRAAHAEPKLVHIPSQVIASYDADWGAGLLGDKTHSMIFDNTKVKRLVPGYRAEIPFSHGAEEVLAWYDEDESRRKINPEVDRLMDEMIAAHQAAWPKATRGG